MVKSGRVQGSRVSISLELRYATFSAWRLHSPVSLHVFSCSEALWTLSFWNFMEQLHRYDWSMESLVETWLDREFDLMLMDWAVKLSRIFLAFHSSWPLSVAFFRPGLWGRTPADWVVFYDLKSDESRPENLFMGSSKIERWVNITVFMTCLGKRKLFKIFLF